MSILADIPISLIVLCSGLGLVLIGLWGMLTQRNMIRMIVGFSLTDTGVHMVMVSIGYVTGGTAPIINDAVPMADAVNRVVDPVPSALVLTAAWLSPNGAYAAIQRVVNAVAHAVGVALTFILMTPIFFLFFVPFRALGRRGRRDRLQRAFPHPEAPTFWIERAQQPTPETSRRQS